MTDTAKDRLQRFTELYRDLMKHDDIPKSYQQGFERVLDALNRKALTELLNAGK